MDKRKNVLIMLVAIFLLSACASNVSEAEEYKMMQEVASVTMEQYNAGNVAVCETIDMTTVATWCAQNDTLYNNIVNNDEMNEYSVVVLDKNTIMIQTDVLFQSVEGYVVSKKDLGNNMKVSEQFHYDGDEIYLEQVGGSETLYLYTAGL